MPEEEPRRVNWGLLVGGGAVITVAGAAAYYIYSKNKLIDEYLKLVKSYEEEYQRYGADGEIDETEKAKLEEKAERLDYLEWLIAQKGWLFDLLSALAKLGIVFIGYKITVNVIKYIWKRWPPGGQTPTYPCPEPGCDEIFDSEYQWSHHIKTAHPVIDPLPAATVWPLIQQLPHWLIDMIGVVGGFSVLLAENIVKAWSSIPLETQIAIILLVLAAVAIIMAITFSLFSPVLAPIATGLVLCL